MVRAIILTLIFSIIFADLATASYFAELDKNNVVKRVIVADREFIDSGKVGDPASWVETFPGKNYAGIGYSYDSSLLGFISIKPFDSWVLNKSTLDWESPIPKPDNFNEYNWNEKTLQWDKV